MEYLGRINSSIFKKLPILVLALSFSMVFDYSKVYGADNEQKQLSKLDRVLTEQDIEAEVASEWIIGNGKEKDISSNSEMKKKLNGKSKFVHNNGKLIKNDLITPDEIGNESYLIGVYQTELEGNVYEKYYLSNKKDVNVLEVRDQIVADTKLIKKNPKEFIKRLVTENSQEENQMISIAAVVTEPSGGYYRSYTWKFYDPVFGTLNGIYTSNIHFDRKSSSANINGVTGSIWDIQAFNSYDKTGMSIDEQVTRMDVNYSAQKIHSYGPYDDAGFDVSVDLVGIVTGNAWSFTVGNTRTNNVSSVSDKYGRWIWSHNLTYMQDPFTTKPGMRVSNTSGSFAIKNSHTFAGYPSGNHATGVYTTSIPDR